MRRSRSVQVARDETGFSLLEILIVLTIIGLVTAIVGPRLVAQLDRSKVTAAHVQIRSLASALETLRMDMGRYPTKDEGLRILTQAPAVAGADAAGWHGPYLDTELPKDPWGYPYVYEPPQVEEGRPRVASLGSDGKPGGSGLAADIDSGPRS